MPNEIGRAVEPPASMAAPAGATHLLFLSHAGVDSKAALALARRLEESEEAQGQGHGLKVWIDKADLGAGGRWKDALQSALASSTAFAVYVGSHGVVNWVWDEVSVALDRAHKENGYPLVPVLAPGTTSADLPSFLSQYQGVGDPAQPEELRKLVRAVLRLEPRAKLALERPNGSVPGRVSTTCQIVSSGPASRDLPRRPPRKAGTKPASTSEDLPDPLSRVTSTRGVSRRSASSASVSFSRPKKRCALLLW